MEQNISDGFQRIADMIYIIYLLGMISMPIGKTTYIHTYVHACMWAELYMKRKHIQKRNAIKTK